MAAFLSHVLRPLSTLSGELHSEIQELLEQSLDIFNKYCSLYKATTHSSGIIGHDDYKHLLKYIGLGLQKWDEDIEKQYEAVGVQIKKMNKT